MNKKRAIKVLSATAVAASAFVATAPAQAASTNDAASLVQKAKQAGTVLKWAISTEGSADGTTRPWAQYNAAKAARDAAVAAVNKLPAAQKATYLADIEQNVTLHINRTMAYIDAITAGEKIKVKREALEAQIAKNLIDDQTETAYHELSKEIRKQAILLDRVYGKTTRDEIRKAYKQTAETVRDSVKYEVTVKIELDLAKKALAANNVADAEKHLEAAAKYMADVKNATMKAALVKSLDELEGQLTPKVKSVSAINAKQLVVNFTTPLAKGTTEAQLLAALTLENKADSAAKLSEDRKTVTYTLDSTEVTNAKLTVLALDTDKKAADNSVIKTQEFNAVFSYDDVVAPEVAKTEFTHTSDTAADLTLTFSEELSTYGTISVNGKEVSPKSSDLTKGEVVLGDLEVGKTYTIDIVGATDVATGKANKAEHLTLSLTVPAKNVDTSIPTVSTSTNGNKLTLTFSEEVTKGTVSIGGVDVAVNDITTTDNKTFVVDVQKANNKAFFANNANFFTSEVIVKGFADSASTPNVMKEVKFNSTFTADKTAASLVSAEAKADGKVVLTFNEDVVSPANIATLTVKSINGIYQSSTSLTVDSAVHPVVDGKAVTNKLEITLDAGTQLEVGKNYVLEIAADKVEDNYTNKNAQAITLNVVRPKSADQEAGKVVTTTINEDKNVITVVFAGTHADGMTDSVLSPSNYTVGGKVLPSNTDIKFVDNKNKVVITLPEGFVTVNGTFTFTASNLKDVYGNTLADGENTAQLALTENIAPTVSSALTVNGSNEAVVSFSEAIQSTDIDGDAKFFEGIEVKVNGTAVEFAPSVDGGKLKVTLTNSITLTDKVTVDFKNAELTDANGNQVKNGVASN